MNYLQKINKSKEGVTYSRIGIPFAPKKYE